MSLIRAKIGEPVLLFDNESARQTFAVELFTISETADFLKISVTGVRRLQQKRHIPFIKIGGSIRFTQSDLLSYLKKQRVESADT